MQNKDETIYMALMMQRSHKKIVKHILKMCKEDDKCAPILATDEQIMNHLYDEERKEVNATCRQ